MNALKVQSLLRRAKAWTRFEEACEVEEEGEKERERERERERDRKRERGGMRRWAMGYAAAAATAVRHCLPSRLSIENEER